MTIYVVDRRYATHSLCPPPPPRRTHPPTLPYLPMPHVSQVLVLVRVKRVRVPIGQQLVRQVPPTPIHVLKTTVQEAFVHVLFVCVWGGRVGGLVGRGIEIERGGQSMQAGKTNVPPRRSAFLFAWGRPGHVFVVVCCPLPWVLWMIEEPGRNPRLLCEGDNGLVCLV